MAQLIFEPIVFFSGVWMGFKGHRWRNSFSRCCNDFFQSFYLFIFGKICWNMRFLSINYVRNQFQSIQWFIFKVRQWFFRRFECDLKDIDGSTHFWTDRKTYLAFEWDLRDIDGATHFQGIAMTLQKFFHFFGQNMLKNEMSIHKFCPQSVLKPSVVHFQGVAMIVFDDLNAI